MWHAHEQTKPDKTESTTGCWHWPQHLQALLTGMLSSAFAAPCLLRCHVTLLHQVTLLPQ